MEKLIKRVIWIDKNVDSIENKMFLEILEGGIKDLDFYPAKSIDEAFELIRNKRGTIKLKNGKEKKNVKLFHFRLFYVIVSGSLSNDFINEYVKATKELPIIAAITIFCKDEEKHRFNAYYLDEFLNPGKVYNEKSIVKIIEYINKDECKFLDDSLLLENKKVYKPEKQNFGDSFYNVSKFSDITFPYFFGQMINSTFINEYDLKAFQFFLLRYYPQLKYLIFPSREKNIEIPFYLLAKFFLNMYTYEKCFYENINLDLSNNKFDLYRQYIFLLYNALNEKSLKPYYNSNLYRGAKISKDEFDRIETVLMIQEQLKISNKKVKKDDFNICIYFSKTFLSFTKDIEVAHQFLYEGNNETIPVLFEVEKINEKDKKKDDFFVPNLDLGDLSEYNEKEVLFLPFSCFEIVSVSDEYFNENKIKRIKLNYLNKYKKILFKYINEIKEKKEDLQEFLEKVINSAFSNEIVNLINFDIGNEFSNLIIKKFNVKNNFINLNFIQCLKNCNKFTANTAVNNLFQNVPKSIQKILIEGKEAILVVLDNGYELIMKPILENNKIISFDFLKKNKDIVPIGQQLELSFVENDIIIHKLNKSANEYNNGQNNNYCENCIKKVEHKDKKLSIEKSYYFELYSLGFAIGDFIANYEEIKDQPLIVKIQSLSSTFVSCLIPFVPKILSTFLPKAIVSKVPVVMASLAAFEFIISIKNIIQDKSLTKSESAFLIFKEAAKVVGQIGLTYITGQLGFKLLMFLNLSPGISVGIVAIGIGIFAGYFINKIFNKKEKPKNLIFYSESSYYQYIPKKFREYCIPTLSWDGVSKNAKSFAIELIEDGNRKWLIINIKKWIRKIDNDNHLDPDIADTIVNYKGISKHPHKVTFLLYEIKKEKLTPEDWGEGENKKKGYSENLSKYFIQVATLEVF